MNVQELPPPSRRGCPSRCCCWTTRRSGMVRQQQDMFWGGRRTAVTLGASPDWEPWRARSAWRRARSASRRGRGRARRDAGRARAGAAARPHRARGKLPADVPPGRCGARDDRLGQELGEQRGDPAPRAGRALPLTRGGDRPGGGLELVVGQRARVEQQPAVLDAADHGRVAARAARRRARPGARAAATTGPGSSSSGSAPPPTRATASTTSAPAISAARRSARAAGGRAAPAWPAPGSPRRVAVQPQRRLQRGQRELVDPQRPRQRVRARRLDRAGAADEQPRLRAAEQLVAGEADQRRARRTERRTGGSSHSSPSAPEPTSSITGTPSSHSDSIATSSTNPSWRKFDVVHAQDRARVRPERALVVGQPRAVGRARPRPAARPPGRSPPARGSRRRSPRAARARRSTRGPARPAPPRPAAPRPPRC